MFNPEGSFEHGDPDRGRVVKCSGAQLKTAEFSRYILEAGELDEKGDLWGLRGQDAEERQRSCLLITSPYISSVHLLQQAPTKYNLI